VHDTLAAGLDLVNFEGIRVFLGGFLALLGKLAEIVAPMHDEEAAILLGAAGAGDDNAVQVGEGIETQFFQDGTDFLGAIEGLAGLLQAEFFDQRRIEELPNVEGDDDLGIVRQILIDLTRLNGGGEEKGGAGQSGTSPPRTRKMSHGNYFLSGWRKTGR